MGNLFSNPKREDPLRVLYDDLSLDEKELYEQMYLDFLKRSASEFYCNAIMGLSFHIELMDNYLCMGLELDVDGVNKIVYEPLSNKIERMKKIFICPFTVHLSGSKGLAVSGRLAPYIDTLNISFVHNSSVLPINGTMT